MATRKLTLEISESLYKQLENVAELSEESIESIAIRIVAFRLPSLTREVQELNEQLDSLATDHLHSEIDFGEPIGREVW